MDIQQVLSTFSKPERIEIKKLIQELDGFTVFSRIAKASVDHTQAIMQSIVYADKESREQQLEALQRHMGAITALNAFVEFARVDED